MIPIRLSYPQFKPVAGDREPVRRLLILGDSYISQGGPLHRRLVGELVPEGIEILNVASGGLGPYDYRDRMHAYGEYFRPDVTLCCYYAGNDLTNVQYRRPAGVIARLRAEGRKRAQGFCLYQLYCTARRAWERPGRDELTAAGHDSKLIDLVQQRQMSPYWLPFARQNPGFVRENLLFEGQDCDAAYQIVENCLDQIDLACRELNSELLLVIFPAPCQVDRRYFEFFEQVGFETDDRFLTTSLPQDRLQSFCRQRGIRTLDLLDTYRKQTDRLYHENDPHFNDAGNDLAAFHLLPWLKDALQCETVAAGLRINIQAR